MSHWLIVLAALTTLVELHGPDGQRFWVNPASITAIREPIGTDVRHFAAGMRCIITTADGKFLPTRDTCDEVRAAVAKAQAPP